MPAGHGLRSSGSVLSPFRKKGTIHLSTYLRTYHIGDYVDIKLNGAIHEGMPHKFYHGHTGQVWNVTKSSIGVEMNKQEGNRIIKKRNYARVEHVQPSRCTEDFKLRKKKNDSSQRPREEVRSLAQRGSQKALYLVLWWKTLVLFKFCKSKRWFWLKAMKLVDVDNLLSLAAMH
ncbi:hypothetical protein RHSIM_Rhsim01G0275700 [Rhododendron simsii]|uniref:Ribosomal protein L21e n=1 Tax=Rhododendron simsii TaxID=118357 RepID=A0A834HHZ9_RHOSS|nr:hypothetical protein RHSIM_Rhsim01G0275700 [Rhododendron simsii]